MGKHTIVCFVIESVNTFFPPPQWDYRKDGVYSSRETKADNKKTPERNNQKWEEYEKAQKKWALYAFFVSSAMGVLALLIGSMIVKIPGVSGGLMGGGVLTIIGRYIPAQMSGIGSPWKFIYLLLILGLFIWLGSRRLNESR